MNKAKQDIIKRLDNLGINKAREQILNGVFGDITSENHNLASAWLSAKEKEEDDAISLRAEEREEKSLSISRKALLISIIAVIISVVTAIVVYIIPTAK